jgi:hypothetical protein
LHFEYRIQYRIMAVVSTPNCAGLSNTVPAVPEPTTGGFQGHSGKKCKAIATGNEPAVHFPLKRSQEMPINVDHRSSAAGFGSERIPIHQAVDIGREFD